MIRHNTFDRWLNNSLKNYKPVTSEASKLRFLDQAGKVGSSGFPSSILISGIIITLVISILSIFHLNSNTTSTLKYYPPKESQSNIESGNITVSALKDSIQLADEVAGLQTDNNNQVINKAAFSNYNEKPGKSQALAQNDASKIEDKDLGETLKNNYPAVSGESKINDTPAMFDNVAIIDNQTVLDKETIIDPLAIFPPSEIDDVLVIDSTNIGDVLEGKESTFDSINGWSGSTFLFMYLRPESLWNALEDDKFVKNFGIEWQTKLFNKRYRIGSGIGLSLIKGYYEYHIEYNKFMGSYQHLDSITFAWDPENYEMQYDRHTSEQTVYDTVVMNDFARVYRKFVYLQIPLILGYDFHATNRSTLGLRFVPVLSILLSKKPVDFKYEAGNDLVIQTNRITADRINSNWQLNAGFCYGRRLSSSMQLEVEPRFTYYYNTVFEKSDNSFSPMGASIRIALGIRY